ncbi:MAG: ATP-grasp domain-containing protein [Acidimicrobiia bacterium]|nr:ATP-grasp domain-containing protein [Acidimicrobiia bacterium]
MSLHRADPRWSSPILFENRLGFYCQGLDRVCPIQATVCLDYGAEYESISTAEGMPFFTIEQTTRERIAWPDEAIEQALPAVRTRLDPFLSQRATSWTIVSGLPCQAMERFAAEKNYRWIGPPFALAQWLNHKPNLFSGLRELGLPVMNGCWRPLPQLTYEELRNSIAARFVAQLPVGAAGSGTAFIDTRQDYLDACLRFGDQPVWITPNLGPLSLNVNAVTLQDAVYVSWPSVQLVGLAGLGATPGQYCGNDFAAAEDLESSIVEEARRQTLCVGEWLSGLGFQGLFGLDFVVEQTSGMLYVVDLNPRWQGSTHLQIQSEQDAGRIPLIAAYLLARLGEIGNTWLANQADLFFQPITVSQMILRWNLGAQGKVNGELEPGVYSSSVFQRLHGGLRMDEIIGSQQIIVTGAVPSAGWKLRCGASLHRLYSRRRAISANWLALEPWTQLPITSCLHSLDITLLNGKP